jgi:hypothetical protein
MSIWLLLIIILLALGVFNSILIIVKKSKRVSFNTMLGWSLFIFNFYILAYFLCLEAEFILNSPNFFRSLSPLIYLIAPFFYFYIRNALTRNQGFQKYDWIHFSPALIHTIELIPFYAESTDFKYELALQIVENKEKVYYLGSGIIPIRYHHIMMVLLQAIYYVYSLYLVHKLKPSFLATTNSKKLKNWFFISILIMGWMVFSNLLYVLFSEINLLTTLDLAHLIKVAIYTFILGILLFNIYLTLNPESVYHQDSLKGFESLHIDKHQQHDNNNSESQIDHQWDNHK